MTSISGVSMSSALFQQSKVAPPSFQDLDSDSSGGVSLEEFTAAAPTDSDGNVIEPPEGAASIEEMFSNIDADGDGSLSESELAASRPPEMPSEGNEAGGMFSSDTFTSLLSSMSDDELTALFEQADADGDGSLTVEELEAAFDSMEESVLSSGTSGTQAAPPPPPPGGGGPASDTSEEEDSATTVYDALDTNQDGTVSLEEMLAANDDTEEDSSGSFNMQSMIFNQEIISAQEQMLA